MKRVALYIRVSTDQQAQFGDSLREQQDTLNEYIKKETDLKVVGEYIDGGISGQKINRDEFQRLLHDVQNDKIDLILFTKIDRWWRNLRHYLNTQVILEEHEVAWKAVSQSYYDTSTPQGRAFISQSMAFAELEAQMTSERVKAVNSNKIEKGEVISGSVPLGYAIQDKKLVKNKYASVVFDLFEHYIEHGSLKRTTRYLEEEYGIPRDYQTIKRMFQNKKYIGHFRNNKNYCEPIVTEEMFATVQHLLSRNIRHNNVHTYIFRGLVRCSCCRGAASSHYIKGTYKKKDGTTSAYVRKTYLCTTHKHHKNRCHNKKVIYEHHMETEVLRIVRENLAEKVLSYDREKQIRVAYKESKQKIEGKIKRLKEAYLNEIIDLKEFKRDRQQLIDRLEKLETPPAQMDLETAEFFLSDLFEDIYNNSTDEKKNTIWRSIIDMITFNESGELEVIFLS